MKSRIIFLFIAIMFAQCTQRNSEQQTDENVQLLSVDEYKEAVYASWIGQIVGNTYGLGYEFKFIEQAGPDSFPYKYTWQLKELKKFNGAFSDDDTDIEYMYLTQMEKNGIEPTYFHLAEAWKTHVKERIWVANRMAVALAHAGHYPPVTGAMGFNSQWFQIDPQLVNEIWAVTAPCMIDYAVAKSEFTARITSDSFGLEPTLHYAAMYSAAFFEKDINKLIDIGTQKLDSGSRFAKMVQHVKDLYKQYPTDWQKARQIVKENYFVTSDYNQYAWTAIDANLNGALGIMALLYGQGDFQKTLDYACAMGMDADNQAATMCGLLGIVNGLKSIPKHLMFPLDSADWTQPFNDMYKMTTREGIPDAKISELANRTALQGEKIILAHGGEIVEKNGKKYYKINTAARFIAPFELNPIPPLAVEVNKTFSYPIYTGGEKNTVQVSTSGTLPEGILLKNNKIEGIPTVVGKYNFDVIATQNGVKKTINIQFTVYSKNVAADAIEILFNKNAVDKNIELIRDEQITKTYYSTKKDSAQETDFYGYMWKNPISISAIRYNNGIANEFSGWFTTFDVEYLKDNKWQKINDIHVSPKMNFDNSQWLKSEFMNYDITFPTITTKGIRIVGLAGGIPKDANNAHLGIQFYTSISELSVFGE